MTSKPRMCLCVLRAVVVALVLALLPAKSSAHEARFAETPVLVIGVQRQHAAAVQPVRARGLASFRAKLEIIEARHSTAQLPYFATQFTRVFHRFVTGCSWLCK